MSNTSELTNYRFEAHHVKGTTSIFFRILWLTGPDFILRNRCKLTFHNIRYFAEVQLRTTIGTLVAAVIQVVALLSYLAAYFPGGITTLRFGGQMALRGAGSVLPF